MRGPVFRSVGRNDAELAQAHALAAATIMDFVRQVSSRAPAVYMAKLRFRDPGLEGQGEDQFLYLWLSDVYFHAEEKLLSGVFFEVPEALNPWHQVGERLAFEAEDVFDWLVIENGHARGGYTIRLQRERLASEEEKARYDQYIGIASYEPVQSAV